MSLASDPTAPASKNIRLLRMFVWLITACAGFLQAWAWRFVITPDGTSYLDVASAYLHGDWAHAINAYWSPFFSGLLALCFAVFRPAAYWDSTVIHLLNFAGLLVSLYIFEFFFRAFLRWRNQSYSAQDAEQAFSQFGWWALGYALFLSTSLLVLTTTNTTPDVWVAAFTYLIAGLLLRIVLANGDWYHFVALGLALGCAYLTKTFYFPLSFVFLLTAWLAAGNPGKKLKHAVLGTVVFLLVAGPWIATLSRIKNRFTFGEVGKVAFALFYDRLDQPYIWQGENGTGAPVHPARQLMAEPRIFEFASPVPGTYPLLFDPSYWMEGIQVRFRLRAFFQVLRQSFGTFFQIWSIQAEFTAICLVLFFLFPADSGWRSFLRHFFLWLPPLIACLNYSILLVEPRYVASFVLLLWLAAFVFLLAAVPQLPSRLLLAMALAVLTVTCLRIAKSSFSDFAAASSGQQNLNWIVAEGLRKVGVQSREKIATLALGGDVHWARLASVKIVAEIPLGDETIFWTADVAAKEKVFQVLARTGATFLVTKDTPPCAVGEGWIPLSNTGFFAYRLPAGAQLASQ